MIKKGLLLFLGLALLAFAVAELSYRAAHLAQSRFLSGSGDDFDLYAVGGSIAVGYPFGPPVAFPNITAEMLGREVAGRRIDVQTVSSPGNTIVSDAFYLGRILSGRRRRPGAVLIYGGRADPEGYANHPAAFSIIDRVHRSLLGRSMLISDGLFYMERAWHIGRDPLVSCEAGLRDIVRESLAAGVQPFLATSIVNVSGLEPQQGRADEGSNLAAALARGARLETRDLHAAERFYERLKKEYPVNERLIQHHICRCLQEAGEFASAQACFARSDLVVATNARRNEIVRRVARDENVPLVELEPIFRQRAPGGITGGELLEDAGHPNIEGHILIARAFARELSRVFSVPVKRDFSSPEQAIAAASYPAQEVLCGLVGVGYLNLDRARYIPYPRQSVEHAEAHFRKALALDAEDGSALLGLGLTQAASAHDFTLPARDFYRFASVQIRAHGGELPCVRACLTGGTSAAARASLRAAGIPGPLIDRILRSTIATGCL